MDSSLRGGFLKQVALRPEATALVVKGRQFSYGELDETARKWAGVLLHKLGRPPARVGVFGSRSRVSYTAVLAALYSGATFVPLNPRYPAARTRTMIELAELDAVFVDELASTQLPAVLDGLDRVPWILRAEDDAGPEFTSSPSWNGALPDVSPEQTAYLLFTSGTTGVPKGVPILHSNVRAFVDWATNHYQFEPTDRFSQTFDQTFDLSVFDLFVAWEAGACVFAMSPVDLLAPTSFINRHALTVWFSVPSIPAQMRKRNLLRPDSLPTLRWSLFCGEPLPRMSAEAWQAAAPNSIVENLYGPTELTIACTVHRWDPATSPALCANELVPIGAPYPGLQAVLVDEQLTPVSPGDRGELCVCGAQTSPGYWHDPVKTAERFVRIPATGRNDIFYRTGDLAQQLPNGEYLHLGRLDDQIKVLGFRVELTEVEGALRKSEGVVHAAAVGWPFKEGTAQGIIAFVSGSSLETSVLTANCKAALPDYMVPSKMVIMDDLPLNANGKVDKPALKKMLEHQELSV
jgi:amino acid adenylation domain-containing protein